MSLLAVHVNCRKWCTPAPLCLVWNWLLTAISRTWIALDWLVFSKILHTIFFVYHIWHYIERKSGDVIMRKVTEIAAGGFTGRQTRLFHTRTCFENITQSFQRKCYSYCNLGRQWASFSLQDSRCTAFSSDNRYEFPLETFWLREINAWRSVEQTLRISFRNTWQWE